MEKAIAVEQVAPNWWENRGPAPEVPGGYGEMIAAMRLLQDRVAGGVPDEPLVAEVTELLNRAAELLEPVQKGEWDSLSGFAPELPSRGSTMLPEITDVVVDGRVLRATVRMTRFHLGGNGAAHGGVVPLVFDDLLGRFASSHGQSVSRTAFLHVDYRSVTPVDEDLDVVVTFDREEGRKRFLRGELRAGDRLCAEAHGLFVALRPGQP